MFGAGEDPKIYIGSADMMTRNTDRRVEIACPFLDPNIKKRVLKIVDIMLRDNVKAQVLQSDGRYRKRAGPWGASGQLSGVFHRNRPGDGKETTCPRTCQEKESCIGTFLPDAGRQI